SPDPPPAGRCGGPVTLIGSTVEPRHPYPGSSFKAPHRLWVRSLRRLCGWSLRVEIDVDLDDLATRGRDRAVDASTGGERTEGPGPVAGEEPEVTGGRSGHLGGELTGRVEQPDVRVRDGLVTA